LLGPVFDALPVGVAVLHGSSSRGGARSLVDEERLTSALDDSIVATQQLHGMVRDLLCRRP